MTSLNKRVYEMLVRIRVFAQSFPHLFAKGSPAGQLLDEIESAIQKFSVHKTSQASSKGDAKVSTAARALARATLRSQLDAISRTARGLKLGQFWLSRDKSDRSLVEMGHMFASRAEPLKQMFIDSHMAADFIEQLNAAVQKLEKTITDQVFRENTRKAATSAIDETRNDALSALERLDPLLENLLRDDRPALTVWQSARHVERYASPRRIEPDAAPEGPPIPPITNNGAAAAQT